MLVLFLLAIVVTALVVRHYGIDHPPTRYTCRRHVVLPKIDPVIRIGGATFRDSVDVAPHGAPTYASPFERWQRESAERVKVRTEVPGGTLTREVPGKLPLGFAPRAPQPKNRHERRKAAR